MFLGTWSHLWFAGVRECPPWCSIIDATVTVHQFFCILHLYQTICYRYVIRACAVGTYGWLVGWLVVLRINVDLAIFQPYLDLEAEITNL